MFCFLLIFYFNAIKMCREVSVRCVVMLPLQKLIHKDINMLCINVVMLPLQRIIHQNLNHKNIVKVITSGTMQLRGQVIQVLCMEYVSTGTLLMRIGMYL